MKYLLLLFSLSAYPCDNLREFTTDLCTHYPNYSTATGNKRPYTICCLRHDVEYWIGGTKYERKRADRNLRNCFKDLGYNARSKVVFDFVRVFGEPYWSYGWVDMDGYFSLTDEQKSCILEDINQSTIIPIEMKKDVIKERMLNQQAKLAE